MIMDEIVVDEIKFIELKSNKENEIVFEKNDRKIIFENFEFESNKNVEAESIFVNLIYSNNIKFPYPLIINRNNSNSYNGNQSYSVKYSFSLMNIEKLTIISNNSTPIKAYYYFEKKD